MKKTVFIILAVLLLPHFNALAKITPESTENESGFLSASAPSLPTSQNPVKVVNMTSQKLTAISMGSQNLFLSNPCSVFVSEGVFLHIQNASTASNLLYGNCISTNITLKDRSPSSVSLAKPVSLPKVFVQKNESVIKIASSANSYSFLWAHMQVSSELWSDILSLSDSLEPFFKNLTILKNLPSASRALTLAELRIRIC